MASRVIGRHAESAGPICTEGYQRRQPDNTTELCQAAPVDLNGGPPDCCLLSEC